MLAILPAALLALFLLWRSDLDLTLKCILGATALALTVILLPVVRRQLNRPLWTLSNLLAGLREGDYSINAREAGGDAMGLVIEEANSLVETMREQRLGAIEASALLQTVMSEIDVAIFAFDDKRALQLVNRSGERLLDRPAERLLGIDASALGLDEFLTGESPRTAQRQFEGGAGRWRISRTMIREHGRPHELLVISDLSRELREEERQAWQRLVRVFGHELNNSLAPIKSIAGSLTGLLNQDPPPEDLHDDLQRGLEVVGSRADSLDRFLGSYARLTKLPKPDRKHVELAGLVDRVIGLETRLAVESKSSPEIALDVDAAQLEQVLINLIRNAVDAAQEGADPKVAVGWSRVRGELELTVTDNGPGLASDANLFVPFFTTKPTGSGIGLALSRQIVEAHNGSLELRNRDDGDGCVAIVRLPLK